MAGHPLSARRRADLMSACALRHAREHIERLGYELLEELAEPADPHRLLACWSGSRRARHRYTKRTNQVQRSFEETRLKQRGLELVVAA